MRGDWLYYKGKLNAFPFKVEQVTKKKIGYHAKPNESRMYFLRPSECFSIHLTDDFMQRNFKIDKTYQEKYGIDNVTFYNISTLGFPMGKGHFVWVKNITENYLTIENDPIIRIKCIHELQHLFKLCGVTKGLIL